MISRLNRPVTGFVLLIDEASKVSNHFRIKNITGDYYGLLRQVMLDEEWRIFNSKSCLNKCLVISSSTLGPQGITKASRVIKPLPLHQC